MRYDKMPGMYKRGQLLVLLF